MWQARRAPALISVHRGLWDLSPENSRAAICKGAEFGIVEIDTQIAADGVPVVMHDTSLQRMTCDTRAVSELTSDQIASLYLREAGGGPEAALTEETVPTLKDALLEAPQNTFFDIDVKHPDEVDAVATYLSRNDLCGNGSLKIDVQTSDDVARLQSMEESFGLMVMAKVVLSEQTLALFPSLVSADVAAAEIWFDDLSLVERACSAAGEGMLISTYTLDPVHCCGLSDAKAMPDPDAVWGRLVAAGVNVIMTDRAPECAQYLRVSRL